MRIVKGFMGCWIGLAAIVFYMFSDDITVVDVFLVAGSTLGLVAIPTLLFVTFERPSWGYFPYVLIGAVCLALPLYIGLDAHVQRDAGDLYAIAAAFVGALGAAVFRFLAGPKPE